MPEPMFERLYRETTTMNWQPTEDIRRRGDQRAARRRLTIAGSAFVAVVVLLSVAALAWRPAGAPTDVGVPTSSPATPAAATTPPTGTIGTSAPPSTPPTSPPKQVTDVPDAALLQLADVGNATSTGDRPRGDWSLGYLLGTCPAQVPGSDVAPVSSTGRSFQFADGRAILQEARAYGPGGAEQELTWFRGKISACRTFSHYDVPITVKIVAEAFGGNESMVVEVSSTNGTDLYVLVRAGNVVTEILAAKFTPASARTVGQRAAARLCAITTTC